MNGADVAANEQLDISVGGDLNVASVQNRYSSTNHGGSVSGGVGLSGGDVGKGGAVSGFDHAGNLQGVNSGVNLSNGRSHSRETMLTRITSGGDANITVGGNTDIKGATIATVNEDGSDAGRLHLETGTLSYTDLSNTRDTSSRNAGVSSSVSIGPDKDGATQIDASRNSSRYQYTNQSGYHKSKTLATVGQGELRIEDTHNSDDTERLNRDVTSTTKDLYSVDRQQGNFDVTVDHRLLSETGRAQIKEDFKRNAITGTAIADAVTKKSVGLLSDDDSGVSSLREHVGQKQGFFTAAKTFVTSDDNQAYVETLNNPTATPAQKEAAYQALSASVAEQFGLNPAQVMTALVNTANGQPAKGAYVAGKVLINDAAHYRLEDIVNTIGHETQHYLDDAQSTGTHNDAYKANREEYADTMGEATEDYVGFNFANTGRGDFGGWNLQRGTNHSDLVRENTQTAAPLLRDPTIDYRQPNADERTAILALAGNDKRRQQELKEAACTLTHCSAEYAVGTEKYNEMKALEEAGASNPEAQEVLLKYSFLKVADNMNMATVVDKLFGYTDSYVRTDRYQAGMDQGTENSLKAFNEAYGTNITKEQFESGIGFLSGLATGFGAAKGGKYVGAATAEDAAAYKALKGIGEKANSVSSLSTEGKLVSAIDDVAEGRPITDPARLLPHKEDAAAYVNDNRASVVVSEADYVQYYVKTDKDGNPLRDSQGEYILKQNATIPKGKYITFTKDVEGLSNRETKNKLTIESVPGQQGYEQYDGTNVRIDFDIDTPDTVLDVPPKSDYLNDIGGPRALGGARQRVPNQTLPVNNPAVTKLDDRNAGGTTSQQVEIQQPVGSGTVLSGNDSESFVAKKANISTGRIEARNLEEQLAMEEVKSNPSGVTPPRMPKMSDTKNNLLHEDGWVKRTQNVNGVEIHYVENINTKEVIDFKFKD
ncbi:hypothetical protein SBX64_07930 [Vibrio rhizosphaerae]|uniref:Uncharacterized protein n=1 Tax=Vibrio rhizosphaerae TaxID=398736 RepID=A0ABU4ISU4_9VIBR|nr:hemagglutinin repeat-containing protein [Vibrio rhizosphaerae]MDW6092471.1 hypothetical protein [Vibrio rhizosphaerae]